MVRRLEVFKFLIQKYLFTFEKLNVWQDTRKLVKGIYLLTDEFPKSELFGISRQHRRAAILISSNIAEGSSRVSSKEQAHFIKLPMVI